MIFAPAARKFVFALFSAPLGVTLRAASSANELTKIANTNKVTFTSMENHPIKSLQVNPSNRCALSFKSQSNQCQLTEEFEDLSYLGSGLSL